MASFYIHDGAEALTLRIIEPLTNGLPAELEQAWLTERSTLAGPTPRFVEASRLLSEDVLRRREGVHEAGSVVRTKCAKTLVIKTAGRIRCVSPHTLVPCSPLAGSMAACRV